MSRLNDFETLLKDLQGIDAASAKVAFTALFEKGCTLLEFDDDQAAKAFDTSRPNASRWRRGKVVPPAAGLVLRFMRSLDTKFDRMAADVREIKGRTGGLEERYANISRRMDSLDIRVERLERRFDLIGEPTP